MSNVASWWEQHGISCPELQKIAIRILSQTSSSSGCERNWSTFDQVHTKKRNRLARKRVNDLVYVHYNMRVKENELRWRHKYDAVSEHLSLEDSLDEWVGEQDNPSPSVCLNKAYITLILCMNLFLN